MSNYQINLAGAKILIVDDTPENLKLLRQAIEPEGYHILIATNGEGALKIAGNAHPDLILLDVQMPGINGFETCARLKADPNTRDIPVIFVTAEAETISVVEGFRTGGVDYIVKPFKNDEVIVRIRTHLKIDHLTRALDKSNHELSAANRQIREEAERKSRFLASMSHELRTPVNAIVGFARIVLRQAAAILPERQKDNLEKIRESSDHLLHLINDILDLSKIEAGRMDINPAPIDVKHLIKSCCATVSPLVGTDVSLTCEIPDDLPQANIDGLRLKQILINLLSNAIKFTEKGTITVSASQNVLPEGGASLTLTVSDSGIGISADDLADIFDEFRQVKGSDKQHKGTGLGLSISRKMAELMGGTIRVESELGRGSIFTVTLPAVYRSQDKEVIVS
jgi:signal transduction histidine kinase